MKTRGGGSGARRGRAQEPCPIRRGPCRAGRSEPKAVPMSGSRIPGLLLPAVFLLALVVGAVWYVRHRDDD
ncbi:hypothetical protein GCM10010389_23750 [Streptomyces echinoruber]|uniref:Uncharacterized protein n=1 Tax=Streptomyces echinoruber TaxID=68898 RepID=A0A918R4R4_9ACTN|nr:hypothetical protein GCM10010389_23750 [Streptomyces echinoruber]